MSEERHHAKDRPSNRPMVHNPTIDDWVPQANEKNIVPLVIQTLINNGQVGGGSSSGGGAGTPALTFSTTNASGSATTFVATDATLAVFDTTNVGAIVPDGAAGTGSIAFAARRDHAHGIATYTGGGGTSGTAPARGDHTGLVFVASGASHAAGHVPDPGAVAGTTKFLREDATWATPAGSSGPFATGEDILMLCGG